MPEDIRFFRILLWFIAIAALYSCKERRPTHESVLGAAIAKIKSSRCVQYEYHSLWDNRFNESTFADSARIIYAKMDPESSPHGFGFYASGRGTEMVYDGSSYKQIRHADKMIVRYDMADVGADSNYFSSLMIFLSTPFELTEKMTFTTVFDTVMEGEKYFVYTTQREFPSSQDSNKLITDQKLYFIGVKDQLIRQIKKINMVDKKDTSQIITYHYQGLGFEETPYDFREVENPSSLKYMEISDRDLDSETYLKQIKEGTKLKRRTYSDIQDEEIFLYGNPENQTMIMFSFIGCGGCEYAMKKMKEQAFRFKKGLQLYYSSPLDNKSVLQSYLHKKEFPYNAFSKESNMNEDFDIFSYPTFVLIAPDGTVAQVISGYDEEVEAILFKN